VVPRPKQHQRLPTGHPIIRHVYSTQHQRLPTGHPIIRHVYSTQHQRLPTGHPIIRHVYSTPLNTQNKAWAQLLNSANFISPD
jgi:hypothetical protein